MMDFSGLVDVWRQIHTHSGEYSLYSTAHDMMLQINVLLMREGTVHQVSQVEYLLRTFSGHNPLRFKLRFPTEPFAVP